MDTWPFIFASTGTIKYTTNTVLSTQTFHSCAPSGSTSLVKSLTDAFKQHNGVSSYLPLKIQRHL